MKRRSFFGRAGTLSSALARRVVLLSLVAFLGLAAATAVGLGASLQNTQRELDQVGVAAARAFDEFLGSILGDLMATADALSETLNVSEVFRRALDRQPAVFELSLVDPQGNVLAQRRRVGEGEPRLETQPWLSTVQAGKVYIGPVDYGEFGVPFIDVAVPVPDEAGAFGATLLAQVDLTALWDTTVGLRVGDTGYVAIADEQGQLLVYRNLQLVQSGVTLQEATGLTPQEVAGPNPQIYTGLGGDTVVASGVPLSSVPWYAIVEQPISEALNFFVLLAAVLIGLLILVAALVASIIIFTQRRIVAPMETLREGVDAVREGNLEHRIDIPSRDELGDLADIFNTMTAQVQEVIGTLEERVVERTLALEQRSVQLQAAAVVASEAAAIRDVDQLLSEVVNLISERFGYYHAGIFMVDEASRYAILRAASSEGGQQMLARGHRLRVGEEGVVGYAVGRGEPRIALDVGVDAQYFDNPDLPLTRSEVALPLTVRERVIGVLDVQSTEEAAFDQEDVAILQTMADQVAVALENARLLVETEDRLRETRVLLRRQSQEGWTRLSEERPSWSYIYDGVEIVPGQPADDAVAWSGLNVPVQVRDQTIGHLNLALVDRVATKEDALLAQAVADQVGQALESARLYQDTQRRAAQERLLGEVTGRMRQSLDIETVLQTAAEELFLALGAERVVVRLTEGDADGQ